MGAESLDIFGIELTVSADPLFAATARDLDLANKQEKVLFLPTHRSLFDHPVMSTLIHDPRLLELMGWRELPTPVSLARARLTEPASLRIGGRSFSLIGFTTEEVDHIMEAVDGHVIMTRSADTKNPTRRFAELLAQRPGIVYGEGTTAPLSISAFLIRNQRAHAARALCLSAARRDHRAVGLSRPALAVAQMSRIIRGNLNIGSGRVEVMVCPPMLGETTLLPRKRALRTQPIEPATLFQAVHIARLFNPEPA